MSKIGIFFKRLNDDAKIPRRHYWSDVGYDLYTSSDVFISSQIAFRTIGTGIAIEGMLSDTGRTYFAKIEPRSSTIKRGLLVVPGTIDPGYEGELMIQVANLSGSDIKIEKHARIAQIVFHEAVTGYDQPLFNKPREEKGFGSTNEKD